MEVKKIIINVLAEYLQTQELAGKSEEGSIIYGEGGLLDSMGVVNLIVDLESYFSEQGIELDLTSEKALSVRNSPFRTVKALEEFITSQID